MLGVGFRLPHTTGPVGSEEPMGDVQVRAIEAATDVGGAFSAPPCRFVVLPGLAADPDEGEVSWVLVLHARSAEPDHEAHLRERSRTAVQRFTLSLQCDDVDAVWIPDEEAATAAFAEAGLEPSAWVPMGLVRCERSHQV